MIGFRSCARAVKWLYDNNAHSCCFKVGRKWMKAFRIKSYHYVLSDVVQTIERGGNVL
jgi:hypothetical protein